MPATERSSVYLPAPVVLPAASIIAIGLPMMEKSVIGRWEQTNKLVCEDFWEGTALAVPQKTSLGSGLQPLSCILVGLHKSLPHRHALLLRINRRLDRLIHLRIPRAPAKIAAQGRFNFLLARV